MKLYTYYRHLTIEIYSYSIGSDGKVDLCLLNLVRMYSNHVYNFNSLNNDKKKGREVN